jgi:hypothetical protein
MDEELRALARNIAAATGSDRQLDKDIARLLDGQEADYTASVDRCIELVHRVLPGWAWHVGWDATGVLPYATVHRGERRTVAAAPTVPLALLKALIDARLQQATEAA